MHDDLKWGALISSSFLLANGRESPRLLSPMNLTQKRRANGEERRPYRNEQTMLCGGTTSGKESRRIHSPSDPNRLATNILLGCNLKPNFPVKTTADQQSELCTRIPVEAKVQLPFIVHHLGHRIRNTNPDTCLHSFI